MMAQDRTENTMEPNNFGRLINQFLPNTINSMQCLESINTKMCRERMSILFKQYIYIYIYIYIPLFDGHSAFLFRFLFIPSSTCPQSLDNFTFYNHREKFSEYSFPVSWIPLDNCTDPPVDSKPCHVFYPA